VTAWGPCRDMSLDYVNIVEEAGDIHYARVTVEKSAVLAVNKEAVLSLWSGLSVRELKRGRYTREKEVYNVQQLRESETGLCRTCSC